MSRQKKEILLVCEERDNHQLDKELLTNRVRHLEGEMEAFKNSQNEKTREIRILEVRHVQLHRRALGELMAAVFSAVDSSVLLIILLCTRCQWSSLYIQTPF